MGIYDRDYYRASSRSFGAFTMMSVTTWLIIINVAVFILDAVLRRALDLGYFPLTEWGAFSQTDAVNHLQVWRFITFQFLHDPSNLSHLLLNMLALYFFGPVVEGVFGAKRYLYFYLLCGVAGAVCMMTLSTLHVLNDRPSTQLVGASAGIFGILMASAKLAPNMPIYIYIIQLPLKVLAWTLFGIAVYTVLISGANAGGQAAHLGGAVLGLLLVSNPHWLNIFMRRPMMRYRARSSRGRSVFQKDWSKDLNR